MKGHIYLASNRGDLVILSQNRSNNFPLLQSIPISGQPLTAIAAHDQRLYVTSNDGLLRVYDKATLELQEYPPQQFSTFGLSSLAIAGSVYVAKGQSQIAASQQHLFLSALNRGEIAVEATSPGRVFDCQSEVNPTVVFDRASGVRLRAIPNPPDNRRIASQVALYADERFLIQTTPGCCGNGVFLFDLNSFSNQVLDLPFSNAVRTTTRLGSDLLIIGTESGQIHVYEFDQGRLDFRSSVDLRLASGHTGSEDIEIRALWVDPHDELVFAASSWGNDQSRRPELPSLFVLELLHTPSAPSNLRVT